MTIAHPYGSTESVVRELVEGAGGPKRAAFLLGLRNEFAIYAMMNPDKADQMSFDRVRRLTDATKARAAAEDLARLAGAVLLPLDEDGALRTLASRAAADWGRYSAILIEALADGRIDRREAEALLPELDTLIRSLGRQRVAIAKSLGIETGPQGVSA